jgi:hypothetical protein
MLAAHARPAVAVRNLCQLALPPRQLAGPVVRQLAGWRPGEVPAVGTSRGGRPAAADHVARRATAKREMLGNADLHEAECML